MKYIPLIFLLFLTGCNYADFQPTGAPALATPQQVAGTAIQASPALPQLTATMDPTSTSGAQATAYAAQATNDAAQRKEKQWKRDYEAAWMRDCAEDWLRAHGITGLRAWWWKRFK